MRANGKNTAELILRPELLAAMLYVGACSFWFLWILCTAKYPAKGSQEPFRLVTTAQYAGATAANVLLAVGLVLGGLRAWRGAASLRRAQLGGAVAGILVLALVQLCLNLAYGPIPLPG